MTPSLPASTSPPARKGAFEWVQAVVVPIVIALIGAVLGSAVTFWLSNSSSKAATSDDDGPVIRIDEVSWSDPGRVGSFDLRGTARGLDEGDRLWAFSSRNDGASGVFPADDECVVNAGGQTFTCHGWAGDISELGYAFDFRVAAMSSGDAATTAAIAASDGALPTPESIPHVDGEWAVDILTRTRPRE